MNPIKLILLLLFSNSASYVEPIELPINTHEELIARVERKFIGDNAPRYGIDRLQNSVNTAWVTPEFRPIVIDYLKSKAQKPEYFERTQRALIALDDEATLVNAIAGFSKGTYATNVKYPDSILAENISPRGMKYLVPMIYEGYGKPRDFEIHDHWSPQREAIKYFLVHIDSYNSFPGEVARWSMAFDHNIQDTGDDPHILWIFQQWWEHNKEAVLAERFADATWIPMYKGKPDGFRPKIRDEPEYRAYTAATRNDIAKIPKRADINPIRPRPTKDREVTSPQADSEPKPQSFTVMIGIIIVVLTVAFLVLLSRRPATRV